MLKFRINMVEANLNDDELYHLLLASAEIVHHEEVIGDTPWVTLRDCVEYYEFVDERETEDIYSVATSPSLRFNLDLMLSGDKLEMYIMDFRAGALFRYKTTNIRMKYLANAYWISDDCLIIFEVDEELNLLHQHYVNLDHQMRKATQYCTFHYRCAAPQLNDYDVENLPLVIKGERFAVVGRDGIQQLVPYDPYNDRKTKDPNVSIIITSGQYGGYHIEKTHVHVFGSRVYFLVKGEYLLAGLQERVVYDRVAYIELGNYDLENGDILIEEGSDLIKFIDLKPTNFSLADVLDTPNVLWTYYCDRYLVYTEGEHTNPMFIVDLLENTVTKIPPHYEEAFTTTYGDQLMLLRYKDGVIEFKIHSHKVPSLLDLCRNKIISEERLRRNLSEGLAKIVFPSGF